MRFPLGGAELVDDIHCDNVDHSLPLSLVKGDHPVRLSQVAVGLVVAFLGVMQLSSFAQDPKAKILEQGKPFEIKIADLEGYGFQTEPMIVNNFLLTESETDQPKGLALLRFAASCKNRTGAGLDCTIMLVGLDATKAVLWSMRASVSVEERHLGLLEDESSLPRGLLKKTAYVWGRVVVSPTE